MQNDYPQKKGIDFLLKEAFRYWNQTLLYQIVFSLLYLSVLFLTVIYFANYYGILDGYMGAFQKFMQTRDIGAYQKMLDSVTQSPDFKKFTWIVFGTNVFLYPLNLGLFKIFRKLDLKEMPEITDLFAGYMGINFFIYIGFYMFWLYIYNVASSTIILGVVWVFITLFSAPLMFFMDKRIFETISLSIKALRLYFVEIVVCIIVAVAFKYMGVISVFGMIFTFPFVNAMIYALYKTIFSEKFEKE